MAEAKIKPDTQGSLASFKMKVQLWSLNSTFNMRIDCRLITDMYILQNVLHKLQSRNVIISLPCTYCKPKPYMYGL